MNIADDILKQTVEAFNATGGNQTATAENLGIARSTLQNRLRVATDRGFFTAGGVLPVGEGLAGTSTLYRLEGERGAKVLQWVKTKRQPSVTDVASIVAETLGEHTQAPLAPVPSGPVKEDLLTVYPIADLHLGMYAWKEETGDDYDVYIASRLLRETMQELIGDAPAAKTGFVLNLGDFFHSDSDENRTRKSGNVLDTDTRYAKILRTGVELFADTIDLALQRHEEVLYEGIPGNHDPYATLALNLALAAYYRNNPRVRISTSPSPFRVYQHGKVLIAAAHGDTVNPTEFPGVVSAKFPKEWGSTEYRHALMGHLHRRLKGKAGDENNGIVWEVMQTLAPRDAWGNAKGFTAQRSAKWFTFHKEKGLQWERTVNVTGSK